MRHSVYVPRDPAHIRSNRALREKLVEAQRHIQELESFSRILQSRNLLVSLRTGDTTIEARGALLSELRVDIERMGAQSTLSFVAHDVRVERAPYAPRHHLPF